jgi:hypothetical protein
MAWDKSRDKSSLRYRWVPWFIPSRSPPDEKEEFLIAVRQKMKKSVNMKKV